MNPPDIHAAQVLALLETVRIDDAWHADSFEIARWGALNGLCEFDDSPGAAQLVLPFSSPWRFGAKLYCGSECIDVAITPGDDIRRAA